MTAYICHLSHLGMCPLAGQGGKNTVVSPGLSKNGLTVGALDTLWTVQTSTNSDLDRCAFNNGRRSPDTKSAGP